jgi:hypothetical protein
MPFKHNAARRHRIPRARYRVTNSLGALLRSWPVYEAVTATIVPVLEYDMLPRVEQAVSGITTILALKEDFATQVAELGCAADAEVTRDHPPRPALATQRPRLLMCRGAPFPTLTSQNPGSLFAAGRAEWPPRRARWPRRRAGI